jgi:predicted ABC-type transport system involved in lysophospholipase L1 biosynthesis ATPase subunit
LLIAGTAEAESVRRARAALDELDVGDLADRLPTELSGGQAQRVAVARAVIGRPRLIMADEPTGQQDQVTARALLDALFARARQLGAALLVATHDEAVAARLPIRWTLVDQRLRTEEASSSR